jgi:hypothetical protein
MAIGGSYPDLKEYPPTENKAEAGGAGR